MRIIPSNDLQRLPRFYCLDLSGKINIFVQFNIPLCSNFVNFLRLVWCNPLLITGYISSVCQFISSCLTIFNASNYRNSCPLLVIGLFSCLTKNFSIKDYAFTLSSNNTGSYFLGSFIILRFHAIHSQVNHLWRNELSLNSTLLKLILYYSPPRLAVYLKFQRIFFHQNYLNRTL